MKLLFVGDCVINNIGHFSLPKEINPKDYDFRICNFEAPIGDIGEKTFVKIGPSLCQSELAAEAICNTGFNVCLLADNHIMDYGKNGLERTIKYFQSKGVRCTGAGINYDAYKPLELEKKWREDC